MLAVVVERLRHGATYQALLLKIVILTLIYVVAFATRLFSVLRYESVIHEFDPYFNFRSTVYLVENGLYDFWNWFDETAWYPLGRIVGGTVYPGLMWTAGAIWWVLNKLALTVNIRNICVMLAPFFASNTAMVTYLLTSEAFNDSAGLLAAAFIAVVPGYISRSVAGSFDNEAIAIFALLLTYYLWIKAVKTGSMFWGAMCSLAYFYMAAAWGGYIFIINLIPLHVLVMMAIMVFTGDFRHSSKLYVAYTTVYVLGTLMSMQIRFIGFQPVQSGEHMAAAGTFVLLQVFNAIHWVKYILSPDAFKNFLRIAVVSVVGVGSAVLVVGTATGYLTPFTGRFYSLLDPTYAKDHIPIIASVSEHQPTTWASFFFDLHILMLCFPAGVYFLLRDRTPAGTFLVLYAVTSVYFAGVMVRLMLVLAPIACILGGIALSTVLSTYARSFASPAAAAAAATAPAASATSSTPGKGGKGAKSPAPKDSPAPPSSSSSSSSGASAEKVPISRDVALFVLGCFTMLFWMYVYHCTWVTSEAYSSPSIVLAAKQPDGSRLIFDDFREAYYWLRYNTPEDARIMSWWDYGYQLAAMANRTILVDNNTWNNTHIATAMSANESDAYTVMRRLDVDYVLVIFGGLTGYASDDINKFLWMVRIGGSVYPWIKEPDYFSPQGEYRIDSGGSKIMLNTLMYKMCYYRFWEMQTEHGRPTGWDRVRNAEMGLKNFELEHIEEAFTSEHWIVRIYKVKKPDEMQ